MLVTRMIEKSKTDWCDYVEELEAENRKYMKALESLAKRGNRVAQQALGLKL